MTASSDDISSSSITIPVMAGLVVGIALIVLFASIFNSSEQKASANANGSCMPTSVQTAGVSIPLQQPLASSLPTGYQLQAVDNAGDVVTLYYADHSLCPFHYGLTGQIAHGAIVIQVGYSKDLVNGTQIVEREARNVKSATNGAAQPKLFNVNGHLAVGWEKYMGKDRTMINGTTINEEPLPMPAVVSFIDDSTHTAYWVAGIRPLADLQNMANNLQ